MGDADETDVLAGGPQRGCDSARSQRHAPVARAESGPRRERPRRTLAGGRSCKDARQIVGMERLPPVESQRLLVGAAEKVAVGLIDEFAPAVEPVTQISTGALLAMARNRASLSASARSDSLRWVSR